MSLQITEKPNALSLHNSKNNLDKQLCKDIPEPLPNYSGFSMVIIGASGSGKTTALYSMMSAKKSKGVRQSYLKCFHKIYIVSPTMANNSIKNDPFKKLPEDQIHRKLTLEVLEDEYPVPVDGIIDTEIEDKLQDFIHDVDGMEIKNIKILTQE